LKLHTNEINVYDKIVIASQRKTKNGIYSLLRRVDARGIADIIYHI